MDTSVPLTVEEAAQLLKVSKYTMYELIKRGEVSAQRLGRQLRIHPDAIGGYLRSNSQSTETLSDKKLSDKSGPQLFRFAGSHDPVIELLIEFLQHTSLPVTLSPVFSGSMEGLIALYKRQVDLAGVHLWDDKTEEYNLPFVQYVLPGEKVTIINLLQRVQGWIVPPGNPEGLNGWEDIGRKGLRIVNRQQGSGTRLRLDEYLRKAVISPALVEGYEFEETTHFGVACRVANSEANAGVGVESAAKRMGLGFVPLFSERYDLVCRAETTQSATWQDLVYILNGKAFKTAVQSQSGYDTSLTGKIMSANQK